MNGSADWLGVVLNWMPMILIICVWLYVMQRMRNGDWSKCQGESLDLTRRQVEALERIVQLLEKKSGP